MLPVADGLAMMGLSLFQLFLNPLNPPFLLAFLAGVTVFSGDALFSFDRKARWRLGICTACMAAVPEFCFFLPVFSYKAGEKKQWLFLIIFSIVSVFQFYKGAFPAASLCFMVMSGAIAVLSAWKSIQAAACRRQLLRSIDSSREMSLLMEEKNQALREKQDYEIYTATLRERNRIAREIHDNVGHLLSRSILLAGAIRTVSRDENLEKPLTNLEDSLNTAMTSIRSSVHDLHDDAIDLESASRDLLEKFTFCRTDFQYDMGRGVPRQIKYCYLAILKEALNNVMKHSTATLVEVCMREQPGLYQLVIRDNGAVTETGDGGIGLSNMSQRVQELGGLIRIHTEDGFKIFITIPKEHVK